MMILQVNYHRPLVSTSSMYFEKHWYYVNQNKTKRIHTVVPFMDRGLFEWPKLFWDRWS